MSWLLPAIVGVLGVGYPALFAVMTLGPARWRVKSRADLIVEALTASLMVLLVHEFFAWWIFPVVLWLIPVAVLALGTGGAVLAWRSLPWLRAGRSLRRTAVMASLSVLVIAAILIAILS